MSVTIYVLMYALMDMVTKTYKSGRREGDKLNRWAVGKASLLQSVQVDGLFLMKPFVMFFFPGGSDVFVYQERVGMYTHSL